MKRITLILICCCCSFLAINNLLDHHYKKFWKSVFDKMDVVFKDTAYYDGIYIGDSRVQVGINPFYIDSITGLNTFNLGMAGSPFNESYFLTDAYFHTHRAPRFAIISVGYSSILESFRSFQSPCYYFYYLDNKFNYKVLSEQHYHTALFRALPILKYTAFDDFNKTTISKSLEGNVLLQPGGISYKGFINNSQTFVKQLAPGHERKEDTSIEKGASRFCQLIQLLKKNNCLPIIVYAPELNYNPATKKEIYKRIDTVIVKTGIVYSAPIVHFDTDTSFSPDLFSDEDSHLTINGSTLYSKKLGIAIKEILSSPVEQK